MSKLTKQDARFVCAQVFPEGFHINVIKPWRSATVKGVHFSTPEHPFIAYPVARGDSWEEVFDKVRERLTVKSGYLAISEAKLQEAALYALNRIAAAYDAPSMGYEDGSNWESIIMEEVAREYETDVKTLEQAMYELEHQHDYEADPLFNLL
jgi:hypothetical protein